MQSRGDLVSGVDFGFWRSLGTGAWGWAGLRGIGPALAGNVGTGLAFALSREGDFGVDVPTLAPARFRCRFVVRGVAGLRLGGVWASGFDFGF